MSQNLFEEKVYTNKYAALSSKSRGRNDPTSLKPDIYRTEYQRDVHRIIYSQPFRRLRHKTQVFFLPNNDHICTRIEHVLHVSSASRTVARHLQLNEDLTEAIGLGHDLGHSPFGHHGEDVLEKICQENHIDISYQHEINGLRVVDKLAELDRETKSGLNLTYEVRDGIISHCGEDFLHNLITPEKNNKNLEAIKTRKDALMPITLEGCIVRFIDKIAYAGRDFEDAIKANLITEDDIPHGITQVLGKNNGEIIGCLLNDLIETSKKYENTIGLSTEKFESLKALIDFNYKKIYKNPKVQKYEIQAEEAIRIIFENLLDLLKENARFNKSYNDSIPVYKTLHEFIKKIDYSSDERNETIVLDFISGMTDNYVLKCIDEIFIPKYIV